MKSHPLFSIVIANYNYGQFLEEAILSVLTQTCQDFELIIVDGGSTDNSIEIIKKYENRIAWWCSERDRGQSHAFNKGFARARGNFLTWLNADDLLVQGTLLVARKKLSLNPKCQWLTGNCFCFTPDKRIGECKWGPWSMPEFLQGHNSPIAVYGPTSFFSRELYRQVGCVDERLHYMMDTDLWMRFVVKGIPYMRLNYYCWAFRLHDQSKTTNYEGRSLSQTTWDKLATEKELSIRKSGYSYSRSRHLLQLLWRLITLSELKSIYLNYRWKGRDIGEFLRHVQFV